MSTSTGRYHAYNIAAYSWYQSTRGSGWPLVMATVCKFHTKRGENVRLLEGNTVAERVKWYKDGAVVFTASPIPVGTVFQVQLLEKTTVDGTPVSLITTDCVCSSVVTCSREAMSCGLEIALKCRYLSLCSHRLNS